MTSGITWRICKHCQRDYKTLNQTKREHLATHGIFKSCKTGSDVNYHFTKLEYLQQ